MMCYCSLFFLAVIGIFNAFAHPQKTQQDDPIYVHGDNGIEIDHSRKEARAFKNAFVQRGESTLFGDAIYAFYRERNNKLEFVRAEAYGHVRAVAPNRIIEAREGQYDGDKDVILFRGDVSITKDDHHLTGKYAVMNRKTGRTTILNNDPFLQKDAENAPENGQVRILLKSR